MATWKRTLAWCGKHAALVGGVSIGLRYGVGDTIGQRIEGLEESGIDTRRVLALAAFGALYGAGPGYVAYGVLYPRLFAGKTVSAVMFDVLVQCPFVYYPLFYVTREAANRPAPWQEPVDVVRAALTRYGGNFFTDWAAVIAVWAPLHYINFRFVPLSMRLPFMGGAGMIWAVVLSLLRGRHKPADATEVVEVGAEEAAGAGVEPEGPLLPAKPIVNLAAQQWPKKGGDASFLSEDMVKFMVGHGLRTAATSPVVPAARPHGHRWSEGLLSCLNGGRCVAAATSSKEE